MRLVTDAGGCSSQATDAGNLSLYHPARPMSGWNLQHPGANVKHTSQSYTPQCTSSKVHLILSTLPSYDKDLRTKQRRLEVATTLGVLYNVIVLVRPPDDHNLTIQLLPLRHLYQRDRRRHSGRHTSLSSTKKLLHRKRPTISSLASARSKGSAARSGTISTTK